ncbi:MAG: ABC transporter substrate-binding protein [Gammaproteobacteria bacterium]|nr:ABC transporter substrate-binding protein [Gammaproteobacteria bacterium]
MTLLATSITTVNVAASTNDLLQVGIDLTYPPYNYFDDNKQPAGFDVEFMKALSKISGLQVKFLDTRFEKLITGVKDKEFDVIASTLYVKPDRAQQINFIPYMKTGVSIAVAKTNSFKPIEPEDLCGKTVASIKNAAWIADLKKLSETACLGKGAIDVREFPTSPDATQAIIAGSVDVQLEDSVVLADAVRKTGGQVVISSNRNLYPVVVGLGLNKQNKELFDTLQMALDKFRTSGEYQKLLRKYNVAAPAAYEFEVAMTAGSDKQKAATLTRCVELMSKLHASESKTTMTARCAEIMTRVP